MLKESRNVVLPNEISMLEGEIRLIQPDYFNGYQFCYIDGMAILSFRKFEKYLIDLQQDLAREEKVWVSLQLWQQFMIIYLFSSLIIVVWVLNTASSSDLNEGYRTILESFLLIYIKRGSYLLLVK